MQIADMTVKCTECGCIAMADSIYCPKCGTNYKRNKESKRTIEEMNLPSHISYLAIQNSIYQFICPLCYIRRAEEKEDYSDIKMANSLY